LPGCKIRALLYNIILDVFVTALQAAIFFWFQNKPDLACFFDVSAFQAVKDFQYCSGKCWMQRLKASCSSSEGKALAKKANHTISCE